MEMWIPSSLRALWNYYAGFYLGSSLEHLPLSRKPKVARLSCADVEELLAKQFIKEIPPHLARNFVNVFTVPEWNKFRRRLITEPHLNDVVEIEERFRMTLPGPSHLFERAARWISRARRLGRRVIASAEDIAFWYGHMRMVDSAQALHSFITADGRCFVLQTVPTGGRHVVGLAQVTSRALIADLHCTTEDAADVYIDNIWRLYVDPILAYEDTIALFCRCAAANVQLNESFDEVLRRQDSDEPLTFLGFDYNFTVRRVTVSAKLKVKLHHAALRVLQDDVTWLEVQQIAGLMNYVQQLDFESRAKSYHILKFLRRRAAAGYHDNWKADIWPCIKSQWAALLTELQSASRSLRERPISNRVLITTDASKSGWAGVIQYEGHTEVVAGPWNEFESQLAIQELELEAVLRALQRCNLVEFCVDLRIDNTSALWAIYNGSSRSYHMSRRVRSIHQLCKDKQVFIRSVEYVRSHDNCADYWSRIFGIDKSD